MNCTPAFVPYKQSMIRGVIFDLGNTLMYFDGEWDSILVRGGELMCAYLGERGYPVPETFAADFRALREAGLERRLQTDVEYTTEHALSDALAKYNICWIPDAILPRAVEKFFDAEEGYWLPYEDAHATLELLRARGLKLALLSNATDHGFIERIAHSGNLAEFFDPLMTSAKISHRKPDPRAFQPILDAWQIPAHEIVMVGDAASFDILGAHRAGMCAILIEDRWENPQPAHGEFADAELMKPDAAIKQLSELPAVIDTMNKEENANV